MRRSSDVNRSPIVLGTIPKAVAVAVVVVVVVAVVVAVVAVVAGAGVSLFSPDTGSLSG